MIKFDGNKKNNEIDFRYLHKSIFIVVDGLHRAGVGSEEDGLTITETQLMKRLNKFGFIRKYPFNTKKRKSKEGTGLVPNNFPQEIRPIILVLTQRPIQFTVRD